MVKIKFANKEFKEYWNTIKMPAYVLIAWSILALIISMISFSIYVTIFSPIASWLLTIVIFGFIGWTAVKDHNQSIKTAAWSGALTGIISGFVGAIIGILMFYLVPQVIQAAIAQAGNSAAIEDFMKIGIYIGLITGPLFSGLIGAALSAISALIAKKTN